MVTTDLLVRDTLSFYKPGLRDTSTIQVLLTAAFDSLIHSLLISIIEKLDIRESFIKYVK